MADGANFTSASVNLNDGRFNRSDIFNGELTVSSHTMGFLPVAWKAGYKKKVELRTIEDDSLAWRADFLPGPAVGAWANYQSNFPYDLTTFGSSLTSSSGRNVFVPSLYAMGQLYQTHPEYFRQNLPAANYYTAYIGNRRKFEETLDAGYVMGTTHYKKAQFRAGLRWEQTGTDSTEWNPLSATAVRAAGFPVASGRATTIPGMQYQYFSQPRLHRIGQYDNLFPSGSFKYRFSPQLDLQVGFSSTIRRPSYTNIAGVRSINDDTLRVTTPNANLKPETSKNYSARLAYYFEPVGLLAINAFQNDVRDLHVADDLSAAEFGYTENDYLQSYTFVTTSNAPNPTRIRGLEVEYSQSLSFLGPKFLKGLFVRASYTRNYASVITPNMAPHSANTGFRYSYRRLAMNANLVWLDDAPMNSTNSQWRHTRTTLEGGASWRLWKDLGLFMSGRNVTNEPYRVMEKGPQTPARWSQYLKYGAIYTFGIKGTF